MVVERDDGRKRRAFFTNASWIRLSDGKSITAAESPFLAELRQPPSHTFVINTAVADDGDVGAGTQHGATSDLRM